MGKSWIFAAQTIDRFNWRFSPNTPNSFRKLAQLELFYLSENKTFLQMKQLLPAAVVTGANL